MDAGARSRSSHTCRVTLYLHKAGRESVLRNVSIDALEIAVQSSELSETALSRILDAHRLMMELRAARKLNAGLLEADRWVLVRAGDI